MLEGQCKAGSLQWYAFGRIVQTSGTWCNCLRWCVHGRYGLVDSDEESEVETRGSDMPGGMRKRRSPRSPLDRRARVATDDMDYGDDDEAASDDGSEGVREGQFAALSCSCIHT